MMFQFTKDTTIDSSKIGDFLPSQLRKFFIEWHKVNYAVPENTRLKMFMHPVKYEMLRLIYEMERMESAAMGLNEDRPIVMFMSSAVLNHDECFVREFTPGASIEDIINDVARVPSNNGGG